MTTLHRAVMAGLVLACGCGEGVLSQGASWRGGQDAAIDAEQSSSDGAGAGATEASLLRAVGPDGGGADRGGDDGATPVPPSECPGGQCEADPCAGVECSDPPASKCVNKTDIKTYAKTGTCNNGTCSYTSKTRRCPAWCASGSCVPVFGWDYNLTHRCVHTPHPGQVNYYEDTTDCPVAGKGWATSVQAEKSYVGNICSGVDGQALPINAGGPIALKWIPHTDEFGRSNWTVNLKANFYDHAHPCGANTNTWFAFMDHAYHGGGPLPRPDKAVLRATVTYDDWTPDGAARAIAGFSGDWDGHGIMLEIDLQSANWGVHDHYPNVADIVQKVDLPAFTWVQMHGPAMGLGIQRKVATPITIRWHQVIADLIARGYIPAPTSGWANAKTSGISLATEVINHSSSKAVVSEMWITNFRVMDQ